MRTIYKYKLYPGMRTPVPSMYQYLCTKTQGIDIVAWFEVNTNNIKLDNEMLLIGTGQEIPKDYYYLGETFQIGSFVWHVYAKGADE